MRTVYRREQEDIESLMRRFKRAVMRAGIMEECNKRRHYTAPSDIRRAKHRAAVASERQRAAKEKRLFDRIDKRGL